MRRILLEVENLSVSFDGFKALDIEYFTLEELELRVVIGPNGAGKTTFLDVLCGKTKPDHGKAKLNGHNLVGMSREEIVQQGVGRKFQTPSVLPGLSVYENLMLACNMDRSVISSLLFKETKTIRQRIEEVATQVGMSDHLTKRAGTLSHGQKQWLEIGMLILMDSKLMLIDEPAAGMTDEETFKTGELLKELSSQHSIIVIEHDMTFVRQIAKLVTVLCEGKMLMEGTMDEIQNNPEVIERYLGRPAEAA